MLSPTYIIAFTGHRSSSAPGRSPAELEACRPLIKEALETLSTQVASQNGKLHLISSAAEGADTIAIEVARSMGLTTHILLPLPENNFKEDFADREDTWPATEKLIRNAESLENSHTISLARGSHERPDCYADANEQMLASADVLIALWNSEPAGGNGGTAQFWQAAEAQQMTRIHINPVNKKCAYYQLEQLNLPSDPSQAIFNELQPHLPNSSASNSDLPHSWQCHLAMDELANSKGHESRSSLKKTIILHGSASILAAFGVSYALVGGPCKYLILFCVAVTEFYLIWKAERLHKLQHKDHTGEKWIKYRFGAELLRSHHLIHQHFNPLLPIIQHHHPEWRRFMLSIGLAQPKQPAKDLKTSKMEYISDRLDDQIDHFRGKLETIKPSADKIYNWMRISAKSALIIVLISIPIKAIHLDIVHHSISHHIPSSLHSVCCAISPYIDFHLYLLPIALPLLAGILLAYRQSLDIGRRNLRYKHMVDYLEKAKTNITHAHTERSFQSLVTKTENTLLDELKEFNTAQRIGLEH